MKKITKEELDEILEQHREWMSRDGGKQADLSYADLSNTDLSNTNLRYTDLSNTDLSYANLRYTSLRYTDLSDTDLRYTDLSDTDLSYVNLRGADLNYANLRGADLNYCNTEHIKGQNVISVQVNTSRENNKISYWKDLGIWTTGCFQGKLEELKERIEETHKDNKFLYDRYQRAIEYILNESEVEE